VSSSLQFPNVFCAITASFCYVFLAEVEPKRSSLITLANAALTTGSILCGFLAVLARVFAMNAPIMRLAQHSSRKYTIPQRATADIDVRAVLVRGIVVLTLAPSPAIARKQVFDAPDHVGATNV